MSQILATAPPGVLLPTLGAQTFRLAATPTAGGGSPFPRSGRVLFNGRTVAFNGKIVTYNLATNE